MERETHSKETLESIAEFQDLTLAVQKWLLDHYNKDARIVISGDNVKIRNEAEDIDYTIYEYMRG